MVSGEDSGELGKSSIAIRGAMIDEVKAVDTQGVELKTLETLATRKMWLKHQRACEIVWG